jgi:hypothetical protein
MSYFNNELVMNVGQKKCLTANKKNQDFELDACNPSDGNQQISFFIDDNSPPWPGNFTANTIQNIDKCLVVEGDSTSVGWWNCRDGEGQGRSHDFEFVSNISQVDPRYGAFRLRSKIHTDRNLTYNNDTDGVQRVKNYISDLSNYDHYWIKYGLWQNCQTHGINDPFYCNQYRIDHDCSLEANQKDYGKCPTEYCNNYDTRDFDHCEDVYCNDSNHLDDPRCQDHCNQTGNCDNEVRKYCETHQDSDFCSCDIDHYNKYGNLKNAIENTILLNQSTTAAFNPQCYFSICSNKGYLFSNQRKEPCTPLTVCNQNLNIDTSQVNTKNVNFSCDQKNYSMIPTTSTSSSISTTSPSSSFPSSSIPSSSFPSSSIPSSLSNTTKIIIIVSISILLILLLVGGLFLFL